MIFGTPDFSGLKLGALNIGKFVNAVVSFLMVGFALYFFVVTPMNKLQEISRKKEPEAALPAHPKRLSCCGRFVMR